VVCVASGPSLSAEDVEFCRDRADAVVVVNTSYQLALWATVLYAADSLWWAWHKGAPTFAGLKFTLARHAAKWSGVQVLQNTGESGLELNPSGLRTGRNGGYQAMNVALHLGAARIVLLGYDMQPGPDGTDHWHPDHPRRTWQPYALFVRHFDRVAELYQERGIEVLNCSRRTALTCFPRKTLREVFPCG
jgi:hypothetical protein